MHRVTFIACLCAVSACSEKPKPPPPPPTDGIELVQPGAEPRRPLRYKLTAPSETALDYALDFDAKTIDFDAKLPRLTLALDLAVTAQLPDGTAKLKLTVVRASGTSRVDGDARAVELMNQQSKLLPGMVVTFELTPAGIVRESKLEATGRDLSGPMQEQTATLLQASERLAMALPDKPVGVGAVWKHRRTIEQNQLTLVTVTVIEVIAIDGDVITFKSTTEMTGPDQTLAQGSATAQVTSIRGTGSQSGSFDLAKAIVLGEARASLGFEMIADGAPRPTKMDVTTRITPRVDPPPAVP
jgi:hypothetical protein